MAISLSILSERFTELRSSPVELDFDLTFLFQMGLFIALYFILKSALFEPVMELFKERERLTEETVAKAKAMDDESVVAKGKYDQAMQQVRKAASDEKEKIRQEGVRAEAEMLQAARAKTAEFMEYGRSDLQRELTQAKGQLDQQSKDLARELATRALGREVVG